MPKSILQILFILTISSSCKIYYQTSDVDVQLKGAVDNVNTNCNDVLTKLKSLQGSYAEITCHSENEPFKTASRLSTEVASGQQEIASMQKTVNDAYSAFIQYTKGKDKITSGTAEWEKFKTTKKLVKSTMKSLQSKGEATIKKATEFNTYISAEIVPKVQVCEITSYLINVENSIPDLPKAKQDLSAHITKYTLQLNRFEKKAGATHPTEIQQLQDDLKKLKEELPKFDLIQTEIQIGIATFKDATLQKERIYSCSEDWKIVAQCNATLSKAQADMNAMQSNIQSTLTHMQSIIDSVKQ